MNQEEIEREDQKYQSYKKSFLEKNNLGSDLLQRESKIKEESLQWDSVEHVDTCNTSQSKTEKNTEEIKEPTKRRKRKRRHKKKKNKGEGDDPEFEKILRDFEKNIQVKNGQKPPSSKKIKPNLDKAWIENLTVLSKQLSEEIQRYQPAEEDDEDEEVRED
jgi:hypothetical protein